MSPEGHQAIAEMRDLGRRHRIGAQRHLRRDVARHRVELGLPSRAEESRAAWNALRERFRRVGGAARIAGIQMQSFGKAVEAAAAAESEQMRQTLEASWNKR